MSANPSPPEKWPLKRRESNIYTILCNKMLLGYQKSDAEVAVVASANDAVVVVIGVVSVTVGTDDSSGLEAVIARCTYLLLIL